MANVYYSRIEDNHDLEKIRKATKLLLDRIIKEEKIDLKKEVPLKVHFGEKENITFIKPENFDGIIDFIEDKGIKTCFMETNALYGGQRYKKDLHIKIAQEHGFTRLPIIIADGDQGENFSEVEINKNHFKTCKIGKEFLKYEQLIVISHFKGHMLAGFGGAIKQLGMGCASKGGKLAMHMGIKPRIINRKCKRCNLCKTRCKEQAITIANKSFIDHDKCVGCGACVAICPNKAISIFSAKGLLHFAGIGNPFKEKLAEYAYAAQKNKKNIYINFAMNITKGCDCEPRKMAPVIGDIGIFISTDPVAIDKACYEMIKSKGKKFRGYDTFSYAEKIGLGSAEYQLIEVLDK